MVAELQCGKVTNTLQLNNHATLPLFNLKLDTSIDIVLCSLVWRIG